MQVVYIVKYINKGVERYSLVDAKNKVEAQIKMGDVERVIKIV
tara:strand:+ start:1880 stop:2008 length:129 start_codon:yes stop_codon:yes gene_type:complete